MKISKFTNLTRIFVLGALFLTLFLYLSGCDNVNANEKHDDTSSVDTDVETHKHDHGLAEATKNSNRLWCNEHGVYEDECFICHPELKSKVAKDVETHKHDHDHGPAEAAPNSNRLWCNEHGVYEDECFICHPELKSNTSEAPQRQHCIVKNIGCMKMSVEYVTLN